MNTHIPFFKGSTGVNEITTKHHHVPSVESKLNTLEETSLSESNRFRPTEPHELFQWLIGGIQNGSQLVPKVQGLPTIASMKKDAISAAFQRLANNKHWCAKEHRRGEPSLESLESVHVSLLSHLIQPVKEAAKELGYQSLPVDQLSLALVLESLQYHVTKTKNVFRVELFAATPPVD